MSRVKRLPFLLSVVLCLLAAGCAQSTKPRAEFLKVINRPRVPLSPQIEAMPNTNGVVQFHFSFATEARESERVTGVLIKSLESQGRRPVVITLHGTGGSKQNMLALCRKLAASGFVAVAIDGRYHGERTRGGKGTTDYTDAILGAWFEPSATNAPVGKWFEPRPHPLYYDTVWDVMRLVDYLSTRDDVDAKRIGLMGISKGGIETYLAAAADKRIAVAVPCIGVQSFAWGLDHDAWQARKATIKSAFENAASVSGVAEPDAEFAKKFFDRAIPGIYDKFDGPVMLPLIAPRPLLVINSDSDPNTPLPGVKLCAEAARAAYEDRKAGDKFELRIQEKTAHQVKPESERAAIEWFVKWLKP